VVTGELNGDGKLDLAVADDGGISVLLGQGDGRFLDPVDYNAGANPLSAAVGNFSGGTRPDLAVVNYDFDGAVSVLLNQCNSDRVGLAIVRDTTGVVLSWPFPSTGFGLQSSTNLSAPAWQAATEVPSTNNGRWEVTVQFNQPQRYFRLRRP
jgi:hypothetical protein